MTELLKTRSVSEQVAYCITKLNEQLAPAQSVIDGVSVTLQQIVPMIAVLEERVAEKEARDELPAGAVVTLRSGGPQMTVTVVEDGLVTCVWHDEAGQPQQLLLMPVAAFIVQSRPKAE